MLKLHTNSMAHLLVFALLPSACSPRTERIRIDGSAGVAPLVSALAAGYRERNTGTDVVIASGLGSSARMKAVADDSIDIAMASHGIDLEEIRTRGLAAHEIARTAVVFAVHSTVPIEALSRQQLCDLYAGRLTRWRDVGGPDLPVETLMRPSGEVDADVALRDVACLGRAVPKRVIERADDMVTQLSSTPGALGLTSRTYVDQSGGTIRALTLDTVAPSPENVASGRYSLVRRSYLLTKSTPSPAVGRFLTYIRSPDGDRVIRANGALPVGSR
jgi:phosphate transport system substrate-binding protein